MICWPDSRNVSNVLGMSCMQSCPLRRSFCSFSGIGLCDVTVCPKPWYRPTVEGDFEEPEGLSWEDEERRLECSL